MVRLKTAKQLAFVFLVVSGVAVSRLQAGPIQLEFCGDPDADDVVIAAYGTCAGDAESDCYQACEDCFDITPEYSWSFECTDGSQMYGTSCGCELEILD